MSWYFLLGIAHDFLEFNPEVKTVTYHRRNSFSRNHPRNFKPPAKACYIRCYLGNWSLVIWSFFFSVYIFTPHRCFRTTFQTTVPPDLFLWGLINIAELSRLVNFNWNALEPHSATKMLVINSLNPEAAMSREKTSCPSCETSIAAGGWSSLEPYAAEMSISLEGICTAALFPSPTCPVFNLLHAWWPLLGCHPSKDPLCRCTR